MKSISIVIVLFLLIASAAELPAAETVHLSVAASMTDVFKAMITDFKGSHPEVKFLPNFASSGSLAKQIEQGAPADIYVSANPKWMKYLVGKNMIANGTDRIFSFNQLVFIGRKTSKEISLKSLTGLSRIALGSPKSVPAGQYAKQAMENQGIYAELEQARKLVMAKDVRQALMYAERGEVDGAFVYKTDALLAEKAEIFFTVPQDLYDRVAYPAALTVKGGRNGSAKAFLDYINGLEAAAALTRYGFVPNR